MMRDSTYGGFDSLLARMEARQDPLSFDPGEALPPLDLDLAPLRSRRVAAPDGPAPRSGHGRKAHELAGEFAGAPELCHLHGLLIAHLRRRAQPPQAAPLFLRLWREEADVLLARLSPRWLVSAVTTFADHGATEAQRRSGLALSVLFGTMKLYESERLHSGLVPEAPFPGPRKRRRLPLDMAPYALKSGGLDVNLLGRLWQEAGADPGIAPLARHLLALLDGDPRTVFRRLALMRGELTPPPENDAFRLLPLPEGAEPALSTRPVADPARPGWGIVATLDGELHDIAHFAAHHLLTGADRLFLYLDPPDHGMAAVLARHPKIEVIQCDDAHWQRLGTARPDSAERRQARNASACYHGCDLDWLVHLDGDDRLLPDRPFGAVLAALPRQVAVLDLPPVEQLSGPAPVYRLPTPDTPAGEALLAALYPTFGLHLPQGRLGPAQGRPAVRTGIRDCRLGLHYLIRRGAPVPNRALWQAGWLGRTLSRGAQDFHAGLEARLARGLYPRGKDRFGPGDLLEYLAGTEGEAALRLFHEEVLADTPDMRARLAAQGLLLDPGIDPEAQVRAVFGPLPEGSPA
ncbi:glycosyltransferase family 2 protein [Pseudooceanicola sp. CBS1P-1]|uniref:Glycosyltransferase family 2 protein n=1 Tax=Pseudooceanicola albus TaxID=2692189 RepID=A0A6L7G038_9RHOB|nr:MULTISPECIES: glycosyltransferase family 2 protein [Pseudooceanicola]MBT9382511.1 glycosyltransferase family 2 protein [Pseudooceanicola endophyticus]MXN17052.1 glycosyltransferase family 2 protein [Pseudooceanicola albus]